MFNGLNANYKYAGRLLFCTGMGRSGTHFLAKLLNLDKNVASYHLDEIGNSAADSFYQYAKWYNLSIDETPLYASRFFLANKVASIGKKYFESNPYLNLHVKKLTEKFNSRVVIIYRDPKKVVESHYNKGWYKNYNPSFDPNHYQIPGYDYSVEQAHHFFGRFIPNKKEALNTWMGYTRVGKIAWMWATVYSKILKDLKNNSNCILVRTEHINYAKYGKICEFLQINKGNEGDFNKVLFSKPGKAVYKSKPSWTKREQAEFTKITAEVYNQLEEHSLNLNP